MYKRFIFRSLILTRSPMIFTSSRTWNHPKKIFYVNLPCLKVFKLNLRLCCYNSVPGQGDNQKWSKHWFHQYMVCYALERHGAISWKETWAETLWKGSFDRKWRITVYNWLKVNYCPVAVLNKLSSVFYSLVICASVLEILIFL